MKISDRVTLILSWGINFWSSLRYRLYTRCYALTMVDVFGGDFVYFPVSGSSYEFLFHVISGAILGMKGGDLVPLFTVDSCFRTSGCLVSPSILCTVSIGRKMELLFEA